MTRKPDVLVIVADCVRERDVAQDDAEAPLLPNITRLTKRGMVYSRAISPSNWTLPSHASMFTGLFPWEHGAITYSSRLTDSIPTFAEIALKEGYRTASFSGNPYVCDRTGLTRGFETAAWGRMGECSYRNIPQVLRPGGRFPSSSTPRGSDPAGEGQTAHSLQILSSLLAESFPEVPDLISRFLGRTLKGRDIPSPRVSPWIEEYFERWVQESGEVQPILAFVNLLDAHEPYVGLSGGISTRKQLLSTWEAYRRGFQTPQRGFDLPPRKTRSALHNLYREAIRIVDARIGSILRSFEQNRDVDNALIIVTSDHGQAFGEGGIMYHGCGTEDVLFRVPLIVIHPNHQSRGEVVRTWTSTTGLADIVRQAVSGVPDPDAGLRLPSELAVGRDEPIWALGSSSPREGNWIPDSPGKEPVRKTRLVGYYNDYKVIVDPTNTTRECFAVDVDNTYMMDDGESQTQSKNLLKISELDMKRLFPVTAADHFKGVSLRLEGWGYT